MIKSISSSSARRKIVPFFTFALALLPCLSRAGNLCNANYKLICRESLIKSPSEVTRSYQLEAIKNQVLTEVISRNGFDPTSESALLGNDIAERKLVKAFNEYMAQLEAKNPDLIATSNKVKQSLQNQIHSMNGLNANQKLNLASSIGENFQFMSYTQSLKNLEKRYWIKSSDNSVFSRDENENFLQLLEQANLLGYIKACGPDGLSNNGYEFKVDPENPSDLRAAFHLCPGLLLKNSGSSADLEGALYFSIAHEMGHSLNASRGGSDSYAIMEKALVKLKQRYGHGDNYTLEHLADMWASRALGLRMLEEGDPSNAFQFLKKSTELLCGSRNDDGIHGSSEFRINKIVLQDQGVRQALGCTTSKVLIRD